jgi:UDP-N-acetylmuramate-alanine ligase
VIEACESDGSIVNYRPAVAIANLDLDHHSVAETARMLTPRRIPPGWSLWSG